MKKFFTLFILCATALLSTTALAASPLDKDGNLNISGMDFSQGMITPRTYYNTPIEDRKINRIITNDDGHVYACTDFGHSHSRGTQPYWQMQSRSAVFNAYYGIDGYYADPSLSIFGKLGQEPFSYNTYSFSTEQVYRYTCWNWFHWYDSKYPNGGETSCFGILEGVWRTCTQTGVATEYHYAVVPEFTPTAIKLKNCRFSPHDGINTQRKEVV